MSIEKDDYIAALEILLDHHKQFQAYSERMRSIGKGCGISSPYSPEHAQRIAEAAIAKRRAELAVPAKVQEEIKELGAGIAMLVLKHKEAGAAIGIMQESLKELAAQFKDDKIANRDPMNCKPDEIEIGDFIRIRDWHTAGQVVNIEQAHHGPDGSRRILLQEHPDQTADKLRWYHLEPGHDIQVEE